MQNSSSQKTEDREPLGKSGSPQAPAITLPKGGGAIREIGEKFAANPVTGTGSMTVSIATSPGRSGFGPQLSLSYDSGSGNEPLLRRVEYESRGVSTAVGLILGGKIYKRHFAGGMTSAEVV